MIVRSLLAIAFVFFRLRWSGGNVRWRRGCRRMGRKVQEAGHSREANGRMEKLASGEAPSAISIRVMRVVAWSDAIAKPQVGSSAQRIAPCRNSFPPRPECAEGNALYPGNGELRTTHARRFDQMRHGCACDKTRIIVACKFCPNDCGLFTSFACGICADGKPSCGHFVHLQRYCCDRDLP